MQKNEPQRKFVTFDEASLSAKSMPILVIKMSFYPLPFWIRFACIMKNAFTLS